MGRHLLYSENRRARTEMEGCRVEHSNLPKPRQSKFENAFETSPIFSLASPKSVGASGRLGFCMALINCGVDAGYWL